MSWLAYFGRGAVRGLEDRVAGDVVDVAARRDADAADLRGQGVGEVIAVQVERGDDVELLRPRQHLLQRDVGDGNRGRAASVFHFPAPCVGPELQRALDFGASFACCSGVLIS